MKSQINKIFIILAFSAALTCFNSCKDNGNIVKSEQDQEYFPPKTPPEVQFDVNNDSIIDFKTFYKILATCDEPVSFMEGILSIVPVNGNEILYKAYDGNLFLQENDLITSLVEDPLNWYGYPADIMAFAWTDSLWRILAPKNLKVYYFAFKLHKKEEIQIGWMQLELNINNGEIKMINSKFTDKTSILID
ncbi:MAG: hypothetical protein NT007_09275 [Candidatus Kapabacteria bacterium]|nr:hypothetical protein [Candidatus Kapabacteria bacterium]